MNNKVNPEKYRKLPITSLITGILSLTIISFPAFQMWISNYLITDTARLIFNFFYYTQLLMQLYNFGIPTHLGVLLKYSL